MQNELCVKGFSINMLLTTKTVNIEIEIQWEQQLKAFFSSQKPVNLKSKNK